MDSIVETAKQVATSLLVPPTDIPSPAYTQITSFADTQLRSPLLSRRNDTLLLPPPRIDPCDGSNTAQKPLLSDSAVESPPPPRFSDQNQQSLNSYISNLSHLDPRVYITAYPSLPPPSLTVAQSTSTPSLLYTSEGSSMPYHPTNDLDLARNPVTRNWSLPGTPISTQVSLVSISPPIAYNPGPSSSRQQYTMISSPLQFSVPGILNTNDINTSSLVSNANTAIDTAKNMTNTISHASESFPLPTVDQTKQAASTITKHLDTFGGFIPNALAKLAGIGSPSQLDTDKIIDNTCDMTKQGLQMASNALDQAKTRTQDLDKTLTKGVNMVNSIAQSAVDIANTASEMSINAVNTTADSVVASAHQLGPGLTAVHESITGQNANPASSVPSSLSILDPTPANPHIYALTAGSTIDHGGQLSLTAGIKGKALLHIHASQCAMSAAHPPQRSTSSSMPFSPALYSSNNDSVPILNSFGSSPTADLSLHTLLGPLDTSVRLVGIGQSGVQQAALSLGAHVADHHIEMTMQARPTYTLLSPRPRSNPASWTSFIPGIDSSHRLMSGSGPPPSRGSHFGLSVPTPSPPPSVSPFGTHALASGLGNECIGHTVSDLQSWHSSSHLTPHARPLLSRPSQEPGDSLAQALATLDNLRSDTSQLTPKELVFLDQPTVHLTITRPVLPIGLAWARIKDSWITAATVVEPAPLSPSLNPTSPLPTRPRPSGPTQQLLDAQTAYSSTRAWVGVRQSLNTIYPLWSAQQNYIEQRQDELLRQSIERQHMQEREMFNPSGIAKAYSDQPVETLFSLLAETERGTNTTGDITSASPALTNNHNVMRQAGMTLTDRLIPQHLVSSFGFVYAEHSPAHAITVETTDSFSVAKLTYTSHLTADRNYFPREQILVPEGRPLNPYSSLSFPQISASIGFEVNLSRIREAQISLYKRQYYIDERKRLEDQRDVTLGFLQQIGYTSPGHDTQPQQPHSPTPLMATPERPAPRQQTGQRHRSRRSSWIHAWTLPAEPRHSTGLRTDECEDEVFSTSYSSSHNTPSNNTLPSSISSHDTPAPNGGLINKYRSLPLPTLSDPPSIPSALCSLTSLKSLLQAMFILPHPEPSLLGSQLSTPHSIFASFWSALSGWIRPIIWADSDSKTLPLSDASSSGSHYMQNATKPSQISSSSSSSSPTGSATVSALSPLAQLFFDIYYLSTSISCAFSPYSSSSLTCDTMGNISIAGQFTSHCPIMYQHLIDPTHNPHLPPSRPSWFSIPSRLNISLDTNILRPILSSTKIGVNFTLGDI